MLALQRALVDHAGACHQLARQLKAQLQAGEIDEDQARAAVAALSYSAA